MLSNSKAIHGCLPTNFLEYYDSLSAYLMPNDSVREASTTGMPLIEMCNKLLTPWRLGGFGDFRKTNSSLRLPYQRPSSSADCARELFNGSNGSASLVDCTRKNIFAWGVRVFCE